MSKTIDQSFIDWENHVFGIGYGTGEEPILSAVKQFFTRCFSNTSYDYKHVEEVLGPATAWLLITAFVKANILEYGTSPRYAWLTPEGKRLKEYFDAHTVEELLAVLDTVTEETAICHPDTCNCGPTGYRPGACPNPFWETR